MKKRKIIYTDNPDLPNIEDLEVVEDFLPPPKELKNTKVRKYPKGMVHSQYILRDGERKDK